MDIYYAVWAQMSNWTINQRAILVLGVGCLIFVVFLKLIGFRLAALFLWILNWLLKAVFICLSTLFSIRAYGAGARDGIVLAEVSRRFPCFWSGGKKRRSNRIRK